MRPAHVALTATGLAVVAAFAGTATAQTTTMSSSSNSCPSQQSVMTSDWYGSSHGYLCAQEYHDGNQTIDPGSTETFSQDTNVAYFPQYYCWDSSDDKDVSYAHAEIFGSGSVSATNFGTGSHVWGAGYLYTLGSGSVTGWTNGCYDNSQVWQYPPDLLQLTSVTAKNLPDNGASKAGTVSYTVNVSVAPGSYASGQQVALEDNGTPVAGGVFDANGNAAITWSPTVMGARSIQVGWAGANGVLGNITDPYTVNVSGGVAVQVGTPVVNGDGTATATVSVQTTPDPWPTGASVTIVNVATKKAVATPVTLTAPTDGTLSNSYDITFKYTPGTKYTLIGEVLNSDNTGLATSYANKFNAPSTVTATIPTTAYPSMNFGGVPSCNPVNIPVAITPATGTGYAYINDAFGATVTDGAATVKWCPPTTAGSVTLTPSYGGDAATSPGAGAAQAVTVQSGGPELSMSSISQQVGSTTVSIKVDTVNIPDGSTVALLLDGNSKSTATVSGGVAKFSLNSTSQHTYTASYVGGAQTFYSNAKGFPSNSGYELQSAFEMERTAAGETAKAPKKPRPAGNRGTADPGSLQPTLTGALSVSRSMKVTSSRRSTSLSCATGYFPLHTQGSTTGDNTAIGVAISGRRVTFTSSTDNVGESMYAQVTCRKNSAGAQVIGPKGYGTRQADTLRTAVPNGTILAGPGRDRITATGRNSSAWGGQGADRIVLRGNGSTAAGGPGDDRIVASGPGRMLAWGGVGRDTLVGGSGNTLLNARDGKGGDTVICRSSSNRVMLDAGDSTQGPCRVVTAG